MQTNKTALRFLIALLFIFAICTAFAKTGQDHAKDMRAVLGVDGRGEATKLIPMFEVFAKKIDSTQQEFRNDIDKAIKEKDPSARTFEWGAYGHRLFFHWGFNVSPVKSEALETQLRQATQIQDAIDNAYEFIIKEQGKRNNEMTAAVSKLGPLKDKEANGIAAIIYDVHILGDYEEGTPATQKALVPFEVIKGDIITASRNLGCNEIKLINHLKDSLNSIHCVTDKEMALAILKILKEEIPPIIDHCDRVKKALSGN